MGVHSSPEQKGLLAAEVAWPEVQRRLEAGAPALLPIGAACKEHGCHLPLNTDFLQAEWLARARGESGGRNLAHSRLRLLPRLWIIRGAAACLMRLLHRSYTRSWSASCTRGPGQPWC